MILFILKSNIFKITFTNLVFPFRNSCEQHSSESVLGKNCQKAEDACDDFQQNSYFYINSRKDLHIGRNIVNNNAGRNLSVIPL